MSPSRHVSAALAGFVGVAFCAGLMIAAAPSASALLCGYPPTTCKTFQVGPPADTTVAPGIMLMSLTQSDEWQYVPISLEKWSDVLGPTLLVRTVNPFVPVVTGLAENSTVLVEVIMDSGQRAPIGTVPTTLRGEAILPAIRLSRSDSTTFVVTARDGTKKVFTIRSFVPMFDKA